jgi:hypothetical protein
VANGLRELDVNTLNGLPIHIILVLALVALVNWWRESESASVATPNRTPAQSGSSAAYFAGRG